MSDHGFLLTCEAVRRQLAAMPHDLYLVRLIHNQTRRPLPGRRLWSATQLLRPATIAFLRARNRAGCDIYIRPDSGDQNAGYVLVDLDGPAIDVLDRMRRNGHAPCLVVQTSPGHLQAWVQVRRGALEPCLATAVARLLAANTARTWLAPTGVTWADWRASPIGNPAIATAAAALPGSASCMPGRDWPPMPMPSCSLLATGYDRSGQRPIHLF